MKGTIALIFLSLIVLARSQGQQSMILAVENYLETVGYKYREECIKESNVDLAVLEKLEKKTELPNDEGLKCYLRCSYIRAKTLDENGNIDIEQIKKTLKITNQIFMDRLALDCTHPKSTDRCEAAFQGATCVLKLLEEFHIH